jgi:PAS domain S-box-containing protein
MTIAPILIVEDNVATRKMMRLALNAEGYSVLEAEDGQTALRVTSESDLAMVLLDCNLPDMDGFEVARRLRVLVPTLPIVAVTGWAHADEARILTAGFLDVLLKPIDPTRLVEIVARYVGYSPPRTPSSRKVVLLADDDAMQRKLGQIALTYAGFEVLLVADGEAAVHLAGECKPDVIVSDVLMPRMDGFAVCKAIRANPVLEGIPIVLMSAHYLEAEDRKLAARFGANRYVSRTAGFGAVVQAVREALASPTHETVASPSEELQADYLLRITHQLERQATLGVGLARQVSLQATALSVLDNLSDSVSQERDPESALKDTLAECLDAAGLSLGAILLSGDSGQLTLKANVGAAPNVPWEAYSAVLRRAMSRGGLLFPSAETGYEGRDLLAALKVASALVVPIVARGEAFGVLLLASNRTDLADSESDAFVRVARSVSMQLGEALALSRMFTKLAASEKRLRMLMESANDCFFVLDTEGRFCEANPATERFLGRNRDEVIGAPIHQFVDPTDLERAKAQFASFLQAGRFFASGRRFLRPDGSVMLGDISASIVETEGVTLLFGVMRDVTERVRAEEALRVSEARFSRLYQSGIVGIGIADVNGDLLEANDGYLGMLGYHREDLAAGNVHWANMTPPEWRSRDEVAVAELAATGVARPWEKELIHKDGSRVPVLIGVAMLDYPKCITFVSDLTDRKRAEKALHARDEQLRQSQKMEAIGQLAGGIAHDFNNVLSIILSYGEMILKEMKPDDPMRGDVEEIRKAGKRAAGLTRQLLTFSRRRVLEPKVLNLNEVLVSVHSMLGRILGADVDLVSLPAEHLGRVRADPSSIEQVILNLVVNARDAMPEGGKLTMETGNVVLGEEYARTHLGVKAGPHVMLAVTDTGTGIDKDTLARIFEPFFTTKEVGKGTGLGLSTVFGIVQQSGGSVWVYSEPGKGTAFKVYLPRVDAPVESLWPEPLVSGRGSETILLVEDDDQLRIVAQGILRKSGYHVLATRNAGEALLRAEKYAGVIDLLLSDVVMPQLSGPELGGRLAGTRPDMKVLFMSGYPDDSIVRHGVLPADLAYVQKPITPDSLIGKVREVLGPHRTEGANDEGRSDAPATST